MAGWNPWHGCHKISAGCQHCYVYRIDQRHGRDSSVVTKTGDFRLPLKRKRDGEYKIPPGEMVYTCFSSDFLLEDADAWRQEAWDMIRARKDVHFLFITKRISRFLDCIPPDWGDGWEHVHICCTVENQEQAQKRLPIFLKAPIRHKSIICEPLLGPIDLTPWLNPAIEEVITGGESGPKARLCRYGWVLDLSRQCEEKNIGFEFRQTGAVFEKDGKVYHIRRQYQFSQAKKASLTRKLNRKPTDILDEEV
jgi:protein gp37